VESNKKTSGGSVIWLLNSGVGQTYRSFQHSDGSGNRVDMVINGRVNLIPDI
jgi:hypothetical protein